MPMRHEKKAEYAAPPSNLDKMKVVQNVKSAVVSVAPAFTTTIKSAPK